MGKPTRTAACIVAIVFMSVSTIESALAGGTSERVSGERTRISVLWWGGQTRHDRTLAAIELFERNHPNVQIDPEYLGWTGYWDRLAVLAAADDIPDVFQMVVEQFPLFSRQNLVADLFQIPEFDATTIDAAVLDTGVYDGRLVGAVLGINAYALAYNPDYFARAGIDEPTPDWTWDDLVSASRVLRERVGVYGLDSYGSHNDFRYWVRSLGYSNKYAADFSGPSWTDDSVAETFFRRVMEFDDNVTPPYEYTLEYASGEDNSAYARGETAMRFAWSNLIGAVRDNLGRDSFMTTPPGPGTREGMFLRPSSFFSIAESSRSKPSAASFINFFLSDIEANRILSAERGVPVVPHVRSTLAEQTTTQNQIMFSFVELVARDAARAPGTVPDNVAVLRDAFDQIVRQVAFRQLTPKEAAARLRIEWTRLMTAER